MILPKALALSVQLIMPVAAGDLVPQLNVEPVCKGIAEQGGVTFRDPGVAQEKKNCIESEQAIGQVYELLDILTGLASFEGRVLRPTIVSYS
jgi:hypothetical protein